MALNSKVFGKLPLGLLNKAIDWEDDDIVVALFDDTLVPAVNTDVYLADVENYDTAEVDGTGYERKTLGTKSLSSADGLTKLLAANPTWGGATFTARYGLVFRELDDASPDPATALLIGLIDFDANIPVNNGDFTITWDTDGVVALDNETV